MAWSSPMTAVAGAVFTAAQWNTHVRDNLLETATGKATTANGLFVATGPNAIEQKVVATQAWVPSWTNVTPGSATIDADYRLILGVCTWRLRVQMAADSSVVGVIQVSTPRTAAWGSGNTIGWGYVDDASAAANRRVVAYRLASGIAMNLFYNGGSVNHVNPFTWADNDLLVGSGSFVSTSEFP